MCLLIRDVMAVKSPFLLTWPWHLNRDFGGRHVFFEVRSCSEEHNCRLGLVLQAGSESKQIGGNAGGKPEKEKPVRGETAEIHLHARGSSESSGCTKEQMKLLGHGSATGGAGLHTHTCTHTHSSALLYRVIETTGSPNVTKRILNNPDWLSWRLIGWSGAKKTPRRT